MYPLIFSLLALAMIGGWMAFLLRNQRIKGYNPNAPETEPQAPRVERRPAQVQPITLHQAMPVLIPAPPQVTPANATIGFNSVWKKLQDATHVMIVGPTHSGKSTTACAILYGRVQAGEHIVILDPHAAPADWHGLQTIGFGRDYDAIERAMGDLLGEMTSRYELRAANADYKPQPLTIFIDEWPAIQTHSPKVAPKFMTELAQEGRKVGMRLIILSQSDRVESLGIAGKGDVRENFTMLLLGTKALEKCPEAARLGRPAAMAHKGVVYPADVEPMETYAGLSLPLVVGWQPTQRHYQPDPTIEGVKSTSEYDRIIAAFNAGGELPIEADDTSTDPVQEYTSERNVLSNEPVLEKMILSDTYAVQAVQIESKKTEANVPGNLPTDELSILIRAAVAAGMSRNKILTHLVISGGRADQLRRIKMALGEPNEA